MSTQPVGPQQISSHSLEQKLAALDAVPLFMKSLPKDGTDDVVLAALQDLVHDGTPDEIAQNFKQQGNDYFKEKRYREALGFYTQGVDAKPTDIKLQEVLLCNRAACNLELKNYGTVLKDCSQAITINPKSAKAFYRSALALLALDRIEEALDCCNLCLEFDAQNGGVKHIKERCIKLKGEKDQRDQEMGQRVAQEEEAKKLMKVAFRERNLIDIPKPDGSANPYAPHWDSDDPTNTTLIFPVFFLYPQHATSDVISEFVEDTPFSAHLTKMFPPEAPSPDWDTRGEYIVEKLVIYTMTQRKRLLKIGKRMTLWDVFKAAKAKDGEPKDGLEVKDGCLSFVIVPKGDVEKRWVEEYKGTRN